MKNPIKSLMETIRRRRNMNATMDVLHSMDDAALKDIGITRGDIDRVARSVIDIHRTVRDINEGEK